jgi:hypothetical protein
VAPAVEPPDFESKLHDLWRARFGLSAPQVDTGEPRLLAALRTLADQATVFGAQNELLPPQEPDGNGVVAVIAENQSCWCLGYRPGPAASPDAVVFDRTTGDIYLEIENGLDELLFRASVEEAIFLGWNRYASDIPVGRVDGLLHAHLLVPFLTDDSHFDLPALWQIDGVLLMGFGGTSYQLWAGVTDRAAFDASELPSLGRWFEWDGPP